MLRNEDVDFGEGRCGKEFVSDKVKKQYTICQQLFDFVRLFFVFDNCLIIIIDVPRRFVGSFDAKVQERLQHLLP